MFDVTLVMFVFYVVVMYGNRMPPGTSMILGFLTVIVVRMRWIERDMEEVRRLVVEALNKRPPTAQPKQPRPAAPPGPPPSKPKG